MQVEFQRSVYDGLPLWDIVRQGEYAGYIGTTRRRPTCSAPWKITQYTVVLTDEWDFTVAEHGSPLAALSAAKAKAKEVLGG